MSSVSLINSAKTHHLAQLMLHRVCFYWGGTVRLCMCVEKYCRDIAEIHRWMERKRSVQLKENW